MDLSDSHVLLLWPVTEQRSARSVLLGTTPNRQLDELPVLE